MWAEIVESEGAGRLVGVRSGKKYEEESEDTVGRNPRKSIVRKLW